MRIDFSDGMSFDTEREYRVEWRRDGHYVVGRGMLCPVSSFEEGEAMIAKLKERTKTNASTRQQQLPHKRRSAQ